VTRAALIALLWALAILTMDRSYARPALRRAAVGLLLLALADIARLNTTDGGRWPHLDVVLSCLWPAVAATLIAGPLPGLVVVAYAMALALGWHRVAVALGWVGELERPRWLASLQLPRYGVGVLATVMTWRGLRPRTSGHDGAPAWTASQRIGLLLAAGQVSAAVTGLWAAWGDVRWIAAIVYGMIGIAVLTEPRPE